MTHYAAKMKNAQTECTKMGWLQDCMWFYIEKKVVMKAVK